MIQRLHVVECLLNFCDVIGPKALGLVTELAVVLFWRLKLSSCALKALCISILVSHGNHEHSDGESSAAVLRQTRL